MRPSTYEWGILASPHPLGVRPGQVLSNVSVFFYQICFVQITAIEQALETNRMVAEQNREGS
jgi:hypothetical protein